MCRCVGACDTCVNVGLCMYMCTCVHGCASVDVPVCAWMCLCTCVHMYVSSGMAVCWLWQRRSEWDRELEESQFSERTRARSGRMMKGELGLGGP